MTDHEKKTKKLKPDCGGTDFNLLVCHDLFSYILGNIEVWKQRKSVLLNSKGFIFLFYGAMFCRMKDRCAVICSYISLECTLMLVCFFSLGSKPFKCKICNFAAAQLGDARNHVKRHLGMREYKCHICGWVNGLYFACRSLSLEQKSYRMYIPRWLTLCMHTLLFIVMVNSLNTVMTFLSHS